MKQNNQIIKDNDMNKQNNTITILKAIRELPLRIVRNGMLFALGFFGTTILAVAISGTIKTWTTGEVLKSADLNTTIASLKTAIEGITSSQWTTTGANISYTAGNVGIGTASPTQQLSIIGSGAGKILLTNNSNATNMSTELQLGNDLGDNRFRIMVGGSGYTYNAQWADALTFYTAQTKDINFVTSDTTRMTVKGSGNVGIGTTSPSGKLSVISSTQALTVGAVDFTPQAATMFQVNGQDNSSSGYIAQFGSLNAGIRMTIRNDGAVNVVGSMSKGSGTFDIAHPDPSMPKNARLRHSFVESPTAGDNIYRWQIKVTRENGKFFIKLPKYWTHLNTNPMVWVSSADQPAASYGYVDMTQEKVIVQADRVGTYNVLLLGTRKDFLATNNWKELGMEYISKGIGEAERILSYNAQPEFGEEPQEQTSLRLRSGNDQQAANEKKLLALEEDNKRLREMVETHGRASLRLEDRLRAIENTQMARK
ncbi:MAG TPA: hypothetical protein PLX69_23435 [Leptospiraceae bacterium]|nr:hypothetical protein [Leptospiraceae bacterium]